MTSPNPEQFHAMQNAVEGIAPESAHNDDPIGAETLRRIYKLNNLNRWMWSRIDPWVGQRVMEAGCGVGTMTAFLLDREYVCGVDLNAQHLADLKAKLGQPDNLDTFQSDLQDPKLGQLAEKNLDTIVCLNVLEHIEDHNAALNNFHAALRPGGRLVLLVPAYQSLYGTLDLGLSHFRRYGKRDLHDLLKSHNLNPINHRYLTMFGILGWWLNGKVLKRNLLPSGQLNLYNALVPFFMAVENLTGPPCGLSHVIVAEKV